MKITEISSNIFEICSRVKIPIKYINSLCSFKRERERESDPSGVKPFRRRIPRSFNADIAATRILLGLRKRRYRLLKARETEQEREWST